MAHVKWRKDISAVGILGTGRLRKEAGSALCWELG